MPGYRTHIVGGILSWAALLLALSHYCTSGFIAVEWLCCACFGSLFPDIDIKSKGQQLFYRILAIAFILMLLKGRFVDIAMMSALALFPLTVRHRGIMHSFWFLLGLCAVIVFAVWCCAEQFALLVFFDLLFFLAGACSHLFLDFRR